MKRSAIYVFSTLLTILLMSNITPSHAAVWSYEGKLSQLMAGAALVEGETPYPPTAMVDFPDPNFNYWFIVKDDKYWYYGKDGVWKDLTGWPGYGKLSSCWSNTGHAVNGIEPIDDISAMFFLRSENKFFVVRKGINANGPMYWTYDRNTNQWVDSGYLKDYWGTPNAGKSYIYSDGGPTAITYIEDSNLYLIIKKNIYWLLRKKNQQTWEWFESGTLAELSQDAPEANDCGNSLPRNISSMYYSDAGNGYRTLTVANDMCQGLVWVVDISDNSPSTGYPDLFSGYTFSELTSSPQKVTWAANEDSMYWNVDTSGCNYIYDHDKFVLQTLMRQVHYDSQMVDPTLYQVGSDTQMIVNDLSTNSNVGYCQGTSYSDCADVTPSTRHHGGRHAGIRNTAADLSYFSLTDSNCSEGYCCPGYPNKFAFKQNYYYVGGTNTVDASKLDWLRCALFWSRIFDAYLPGNGRLSVGPSPEIASFVNTQLQNSNPTLKQSLPILNNFDYSKLSTLSNHRTHQHLYLGGKNVDGTGNVDWTYLQDSQAGWFYLVTEYPVQ